MPFIKVQPQLEGTWARFPDGEYGTAYQGKVVFYDPLTGATNWGDQPCGRLDIQDDEGQTWMVSLDSASKRDGARGLNPYVGQYIRIEYVEDRPSKNPRHRPWKRFEFKYDPDRSEAAPPAGPQPVSATATPAAEPSETLY